MPLSDAAIAKEYNLTLEQIEKLSISHYYNYVNEYYEFIQNHNKSIAQ